MTVPQLIEERQTELGITDLQVAEAIGYENPNVITLIKSGAMRLPVGKVLDLAGIIDVEASDLLYLAIKEADPMLLRVLERSHAP